MDLVDIILSKKASTGAAAPLIKEAKEAVIAANEAVDTINDIIEDTQSANEAANQASAVAEEAASKANSAADTYNALVAVVNESIITNFDEAFQKAIDKKSEEIDNSINEIKEEAENKVSGVEVFDDNTPTAKVKKTRVRKKNLTQAYEVSKNYTSTGTNEDGSMTQKAISDALTSLAEKIEEGSGSVSGNFENANPGNVVIVGENNKLATSSITEEALIDSLIKTDSYSIPGSVGLKIDYVNKNFTRVQSAANLSEGEAFDTFTMYGGRKRCIVNKDGQIVAWHGDENYVEDGTVGQIMIYQPKFYYDRIVTSSEEIANGEAIREEILIISEKEQPGFKVHPLFKDENGAEIDYVLLPAYESTFFDVSENKIITNDAANIDSSNDYLMSIAGIKPISGANKAFTVEVAEQMAKNIGSGWHITNMAAESANQMLETIEFGQLNMQEALEEGIVKLTSSTVVNGASITGSTSSLGNVSGAATSTTGENDGTYTEYDQPGYRAISYRGFENPWGNIFRFVGGINISGDGNGAGTPFIAKDYNYTPDVIGNNYESLGFSLTTSNSWISAFGYNKNGYEWVSLPIESQGASSLLPIGDFVWVENGFSGINAISIGGAQRQGDSCGPFYYACDLLYTKYSASQSARIMHIPTKDSEIYLANIASWKQQMGA